MKKSGMIQLVTALARGILHDTKLRRKMMTQLVIVLLIAVAIGHWVIGSWLEKSILAFTIVWGLIFIYTVMLVLLCIYDMLMVKNNAKK